MHPFPHIYKVSARPATAGEVTLESTGLENVISQPPAEFGGPGDQWSPETLLAAAVADCFVLSFRAIANASNFEFNNLQVEVSATLDKVDRTSKFTELHIHADLEITNNSDSTKASRLLEKAEQACLISNSLNAEVHLQSEVHSA
jgi:peroxiredoxin-like protein